MEVPTGWKTLAEDEVGLKAASDVAIAGHHLTLLVGSQDAKEATAEQFAILSSMMAPQMVPEGVEVTDVSRDLIDFNGNVASITEVDTDKGVFAGVLAFKPDGSDVGYTVACIAAEDKKAAALCAAITKTFKVK